MTGKHKALNRMLGKGKLDNLRRNLEQLEESEREAWIQAQDKDGTTQLHKACEKGFADIAEFLIDSGIDVNARKRDGKTPLHEVSSIAFRILAKGR